MPSRPRARTWPDDQIAKMLDWDAPLSQQAPEVQQALKPLLDEIRANVNNPDPARRTLPDVIQRLESGEVTGQALYHWLTTPGYPATKLQKAGIPGIKYLDQGSRAAGEGTRNYVTFSDAILKILERQ
jgi:hypothetical protein